MSSNIKLDFPASDIQIASELKSPSGGCWLCWENGAWGKGGGGIVPLNHEKRRGGSEAGVAEQVTARKPGTGQSLKKIDQGKGPPLKF